MEHGSRTRMVTALVLAVVFGSGVMIGLAADGTLAAGPPEAAVESPEEKDDGEEPRRRTPVYERVDPTRAQMVLIDSIVTEHRARMSALHDEFDAAYSPRYRAVILETRDAIKAVLTPEQAAEYQRLLDERDQRRAEREKEEDDKDRD